MPSVFYVKVQSLRRNEGYRCQSIDVNVFCFYLNEVTQKTALKLQSKEMKARQNYLDVMIYKTNVYYIIVRIIYLNISSFQ